MASKGSDRSTGGSSKGSNSAPTKKKLTQKLDRGDIAEENIDEEKISRLLASPESKGMNKEVAKMNAKIIQPRVDLIRHQACNAVEMSDKKK